MMTLKTRIDDRSLTAAILLTIIVVAVVARLLAAVYMGDSTPPYKDESSYSILAQRLVDGHGLSFAEYWYPVAQPDEPTSQWSFLYTGFIAVVYSILGFHPLAVRIISAVIGGILLPWMIFRLSKRVRPDDERLALLAAALTAIYAYFILFSAQLMTETFFIIAVVWSLERAISLEQQLGKGEKSLRNLGITALGMGISLALATLLRQSILPWLVPLFLYLLWTGYRNQLLRRTILVLGLATFLVTISILPFTIRNYRVYDEFLLLNSNAGYAMYAAQHPHHGTSFQAFQGAPLPTDIRPVPQNEAEWDRVLLRAGIDFIIEDPGRYALLSLSRVADLFMFWPSPDTSLFNNIGRVVSFGLFLPIMLLGLWVSRHDWRRYTLLYLFMAFYAVMHLLTWSMIRYRLPIDAVLMLFAAMGLMAIIQRLQNYFIQRKQLNADLDTG